MRQPWRLLALLSVTGLLAAGCSSSPAHSSSPPKKTTTTTTAPATTTTISAPAATTTTAATTPSGCSGVTAAAGSTNGAAGTITGTIILRETGPTCTVTGYPTLALQSATGGPLPTTVMDGLTVDISAPANGAPAPVTWSPSSPVTFTYQYSDVTSGNETSCPTATLVTVTPPGFSAATPRFNLTLTPCDNGTVRVSPLYAAG